jgi:hypothetical protein
MVPGDALLIDGIELEDGWQWRPDVVEGEVAT